MVRRENAVSILAAVTPLSLPPLPPSFKCLGDEMLRGIPYQCCNYKPNLSLVHFWGGVLEAWRRIFANPVISLEELLNLGVPEDEFRLEPALLQLAAIQIRNLKRSWLRYDDKKYGNIGCTRWSSARCTAQGMVATVASTPPTLHPSSSRLGDKVDARDADGAGI